MDPLWSDPHLPRYLALGAMALLCALFAASETALFALTPLDRLRLREKNRVQGERVEALLAQPRRLLVTVLMGVETINILASIVATSLALSLWGPQGKWLALGLLAPAFLLVAELIPKSLALINATRLAPWLALLVKPAILVFTPMRLVLLQISRGILATLGFRPEIEVPAVRQEDFVRMVEESHLRGMIAEVERDFIQNLLSFGELRVGQIMVPRPEIFSLPLDMPCPEMIQAIKRSRFSRIPIYRDNPDAVLGILHAKDVLAMVMEGPCGEEVRENLLRPAYYVPENKKAFDLLTELLARHLRLALVVDEYGSLMGLVSIEDLLEELCGEIPQEFQVEEKPLVEIAPGVWRVKATLSLADFNEALGLELPTAEFDTIGGLVLNLFGALPREGGSVALNHLRFRVTRMKGTRILEMEVRREQP
ncbi:MAG: hemolysin family protein [Desulfobaccales bacterium]